MQDRNVNRICIDRDSTYSVAPIILLHYSMDSHELYSFIIILFGNLIESQVELLKCRQAAITGGGRVEFGGDFIIMAMAPN